MTELVKSPCIGCRFAEWERTKNGKLHPNKLGHCTWGSKMSPMPWWAEIQKQQLARLASVEIDRCDMHQDNRRATCDAREEA